jgi:hypothetical protein
LTWRKALALSAAGLILAGCGQSEAPSPTRGQLEDYLAQVEPIRSAVNRLLNRADPILSAYGEHRLDARAAQRRVNALERRFAAYAVKIAEVRSVPIPLRALQRSYAHTYVLEDAYLSALAAALPDRSFDELPNTQSRQRAAIIAWRIGLEVLAGRLDAHLLPDIQVAGRGEIAPSPSGS